MFRSIFWPIFKQTPFCPHNLLLALASLKNRIIVHLNKNEKKNYILLVKWSKKHIYLHIFCAYFAIFVHILCAYFATFICMFFTALLITEKKSLLFPLATFITSLKNKQRISFSRKKAALFSCPFMLATYRSLSFSPVPRLT